VKANALTASQAVIVPVRDSNINIDGSTQIAQRSLSADRIIANSITSNEINTGSISIGVWSGSLDNVADGSTYFRPTANQKNGGGYAFSGLDSSGNVKIPVDSTKMSSGSAPSTGIFIDSTGIYGRYGGVNKFSMLTASGSATFSGTITASTITGTTLTTATSGQRTELTSTLINFYNTSGSNLGTIYAGTGLSTSGLLITTAGLSSNIMLDTSTNISIGIASSLKYLFTSTYFVPNTTNTIDLGSTGAVWKDLHIGGVHKYQGTSQPLVYWGYVSGTVMSPDNTPGWTVTNPSTGKYTISHSLGHSNYAIIAISLVGAGSAYAAKIEAIADTTAQVTIFDDTGIARASDFMFILTEGT